MIYRLIYCNRNGDSARIDIIKGALTPVETIEGTDNPFLLSYKMDTSNKSGFFMTSSANISVYESGTFNIDNLKTSSETELKVEYYINDVLFWSGFIIPDFFSRNIGVPATIEMVASDRIGTLKGSTLSSLTQYVTMRDIAVACLAKTGLSLPLLTMADFGNNGQTNAFFKSLGLSGRLSDTKGRNISCYDILRSILVACDGKLSQQDGAWYIVNKFQHETGSGNLFSSLTASTPYVEQSVPFSEVDTGARRTIIPVAATTGVYHEHGGGRKYPDNYNFADGLAGWTAKNGFVASIDNKKIDFYLFGAPSFSATETVPPYLLNNNQRILSGNSMDLVPYIESSPIAVKAVEADRVKVNIDISVTAPGGASHLTDPAAYPSFVRYAVIATNGPTKLALNRSGAFETYNPNSYETQTLLTHVRNTLDRASFADDISSAVSGTLIAGNDIANYSITIRIYGSGTYQTVLINQATITFSTTNSQLPKGTIYRRNQGAGFTSEYPTDTTIFGDYMSIGLNGYFYNYSIDDTSSLFSAPDVLIQPKWTTHADANELPLLQHVARQRSRMFSIAHDLINASIDVEAFKPLSIFVDCNSKRYCVVSANFDFLRSKVEVEIEQISYASLEVREFIYSYFGDSDTGISSVGGITGGSTGTGTGGGMTAEQIEILNNLSSWWKLDSSDILYSDKNVRAPSFIGSLTGNADTATKLQTARTIAGVSFDGTANIAIPFANLSSKPTTLAGYGITNAYTKTEVDTALALKLNKSVFDDLFEKVEVSTGVFAIKAKYSFYSTGEVSAYGIGSGGSGGGSYDRLDAWVDYDSTKSGWVLSALLGVDLNTRVGNLEGGSALTLNTTGTGNAITSISKAGTVITANKGLTFALASHTHTSLYVPDTRAIVSVPENLQARELQLDFKNNTSVGNPPITASPTFSHIISFAGWNAAEGSGGWPSQMSIGDGIAVRQAVNATTWGAWRNVYHTGNLLLVTTSANGLMSATDKSKLDGIAAGAKTGTVTSVAMTVPTGLSISGSPITTSGTLAVSLASGYSIPTTAKQTQWDTAYTHSQASHAYLPLSGGTMSNTNLVTNLNADLLDGYHASSLLKDITTNYGTTITSANDYPTDLLSGIHRVHISNVEYASILTGYDYVGNYWQLRFRPSYGRDIYYRNNASAAWSVLAFTDSNVASATKLQTSRTIWGQSFDGTGNVTGALSGATTGVFSSNITSNSGISSFYDLSISGVSGAAAGVSSSGLNFKGFGAAHASINWMPNERTFRFNTGDLPRDINDVYGPANIDVSGNIKSSGKINALSIGSKFGPNDGITSLPALGTEGNTFGIGGFYGFRFNVLSNGNGNLQIGRFSGGANAYNLILQSQGGNVGIGEPSPSAKLHVAGNILSTGEITAYVASDRRLKENIKPIISALDYINKLNPVSYYWNAKAKELNPMKSDSLDYGLIAQEVENVLPGVVHGIFDDKYKSIDYIKLIPIMIAAIKELKQKVNKL